jgi:hypothetical protein
MMQVNGAIYLSLVCPFGKRLEATMNSPRNHDLFISLSTILITNPGGNWHLTLAKETPELITLNKTEKCFRGLDFKIGLIPLGKCHGGKLAAFLCSASRDCHKNIKQYICSHFTCFVKIPRIQTLSGPIGNVVSLKDDPGANHDDATDSRYRSNCSRPFASNHCR